MPRILANLKITLAILILLPAAFSNRTLPPTSTPSTSQTTLRAVQRVLTPRPTPHFPDFTSNYQKTVVIPAQQAAQAAAQAVSQAQAVQTPQPTTSIATAPQTAGDCAEWIAAAGIADVADAMLVINHESGCNPYAVEPRSGACNVAQELPCGKSGCALGDGACDVAWMNQYVLGRYGSWAGAWAHELALGWY